ncbi:class I SAM-dependent methyltransferase [Ectopseudomonas mendocina]|uniref:Class I SAM-dependent methyltransferase n=1 Tax=Ectopseudomonas mendocina S5.2 TaxID=1225174 RepID=A0ABM5VVG6_ECTME|nr:class I SAM-dependent methyltransferase [Pseudomonas mendocina]ALN18852.1 hypothetical protein DW68_009485 [Pseudomonas mendocina S5.2]KES00291.1 hypothetical protein HN51_10700 [Pseudomonas mendocina]
MVSRELIARHCICCGGEQLQRSSAVLMPFVAHRVFGHEPLEITADWGLRDLRQGMAYTLCNSLQCQECGVLFLDYRFTDEQMAALYAGYRDERYNAERERYEPGYTALTKSFEGRAAYISDIEAWLAPHLPAAPAVLDWGGATGLNTPLRGRGGLHHVHDISDVGLVAGAQRADALKFGQQHYDLVVCSQVLEHVPAPLDLISQIVPILSAETLFYLEVPHEILMREHPDSLQLAPLKRYWHEHINFFSKESLYRMIERVGLRVLDSHILPVELRGRKGSVMGVLARLP